MDVISLLGNTGLQNRKSLLSEHGLSLFFLSKDDKFNLNL